MFDLFYGSNLTVFANSLPAFIVVYVYWKLLKEKYEKISTSDEILPSKVDDWIYWRWSQLKPRKDKNHLNHFASRI